MQCFACGRAAAVLAAWFFVVIAAAHGAEASAPGADAKPGAPAAESDSEEGRYRGWQVFVAAANLWPRLDETEAKIDRLINNGVGRLCPRWEEPRTFSDWRDDGMLWDFQLGVGRDIADKWTWYAAAGGAFGHQPNSHRYFPLGLPMKIGVDFDRSAWFVTSGLDYYPWGVPEYPEDGPSILACLRAAKPYVEGAIGYVYLKGRAECSFALPLLGEFAHYQDKAQYDLFYLSPRLGVDIPVSKRNSVSVAAGPLLFTTHEHEFNNVSIYTVLRHRF